MTDRDKAAALTNSELWIPRRELPPLATGEFYVQDLIGQEVLDLEGRPRGIVKSLFWNGAQDILEVKSAAGEELLIPVVPAFIHDVDWEARRIVVDPHE